MSWTAPPRTAAARAAIEAAAADRDARPERYRLEVDAVAEAAVRSPGDDAAFAPGWREGLAAYLGSAREDGRLNPFGEAMVVRSAIGRLRAGAAMARLRERRPELPARPPIPPIVITGGWRTGTTFLFRLLATDDRLRAPLPAELTAPWRLSSLRGAERDAAIDAAQPAHDLLHALNPTLQAVHDSGARLPEECVLGLGADLRNWAFTSTTRLDGYSAWLDTQDLTAGYAGHARALAALDHGDGRRWVLKAPPHLAELGPLAAAFPGAVVVVLHRDIVETIASGASLFAVFRSTYSDEIDPVDVGRFQADQTERWLRRAAAFRRSPGAAGVTVLDVAYRDLVADPTAILARVWAAAGMDPAPDPAGLVAAHAAAQPRHGHGQHRYGPDDFGLDGPALRERFGGLVPTE